METQEKPSISGLLSAQEAAIETKKAADKADDFRRTNKLKVIQSKIEEAIKKGEYVVSIDIKVFVMREDMPVIDGKLLGHLTALGYKVINQTPISNSISIKQAKQIYKELFTQKEQKLNKEG